MVKERFQTNFTTDQARKVQQLNHPERVHVEVIVREATDEQVEQFIQQNIQPERKRIVWNKRFLGHVVNANKNLAKGKVQFINGKMINPVKLDLSGLKKGGNNGT